MARYAKVMKRNWSDDIFHFLNGAFLIGLVIVTLYPFWNTAAVSFNAAVDTVKGGVFLWPREFTLANYESIFNDDVIYHAFMISVLRTVSGTVLGVFCTAMLAYVISRRDFMFRRSVTTIFILTMYFNGGIIPTFMLMRGLGLTNSFFVYIIPGLVVAFNLIIIRSFIQGLPESLVESGKIDGAGDFRIFMQIIFPLCMPVIATISLFIAVGQWNNWFDTFLYNSSNLKLSTLQYELMKKLQSANTAISGGSAESAFANSNNTSANVVTPTSIRAAITIVATVPILLVYPFLQKYFVKGMTLGGVKE